MRGSAPGIAGLSFRLPGPGLVEGERTRWCRSQPLSEGLNESSIAALLRADGGEAEARAGVGVAKPRPMTESLRRDFFASLSSSSFALSFTGAGGGVLCVMLSGLVTLAWELFVGER